MLVVFFDALPALENILNVPENLAARIILRNISDRLFEPMGTNQTESTLLKTYSVSSNGLVYRFQLKEGSRFHDGSEITAGDIIHSLETAQKRLQDQGCLSDLVGFSEHVLAKVPLFRCVRTSKYRFDLQLSFVVPNLREILSKEEFSLFSSQGKVGEIPIFSGNYRISDIKVNSIRLEAHTDHPCHSEKAFKIIELRSLHEDNPSLEKMFQNSTMLVASSYLSLSTKNAAILNSRQARSLTSGKSFFLLVNPEHRQTDILRTCLQNYLTCREFTELFPQVEPLAALFPMQHTLHQNIAFRRTTSTSVPLNLRILFACDPYGEHYQQKIIEGAANYGLNLEFLVAQNEEDRSVFDDAQTHAILLSLDLHSADAMSSLQFFRPGSPYSKWVPQQVQTSFRALRSSRNCAGSVQIMKGICREIVTQGIAVPLVFVPDILCLSPLIEVDDKLTPSSTLIFRNMRQKFVAIDKENMRRTRLEAIGATTQMFAHDVRKPFSTLRMIMELLRNATTMSEMRSVADKMLPEVDRAMRSVNGMIQDVMEIGSRTKPTLEPTSPETMIESTLREVFRIFPDADVQISYRFDHTHMVLVDPLKILRVFSNIITNSLQAMSGKGEIWIETLQYTQDALKFTIGNSNSFIPPDDIQNVFEAFYTSRKKGGTGLGMAIAAKIVTEHGGQIWCDSLPGRGVEFYFSVPVAKEQANVTSARLPTHSREINTAFQIMMGVTQGKEEQLSPDFEMVREMEIINYYHSSSQQIEVLIIDDESVYRSLLRNQLKNPPELSESVNFTMVASSDEALAIMKSLEPDLIICDIDLGPHSLSGFELVKKLRSQKIASDVCVHSNQDLTEIYKTSLDAGANSFLPKPMTRSHLLGLIANVAQRKRKHGWVTIKENTRSSGKRVIVVDDDIFTLESWETLNKGKDIETYTCPDDFWKSVSKCPLSSETVLCIVTDFFFDSCTDQDGGTFCQKLKLQNPDVPVFLCSDGEFEENTLSQFDGKLEKRAYGFALLEEIVSRRK